MMCLLCLIVGCSLGNDNDDGAMSAMDSLLGTDASGGNLLRIDPDTGTGTVVGPMVGGTAFSFPSLAMDPITGVVYAGSGGGFAEIYTVGPSSGTLNFVGDTTLGIATIGGMDFSADGTLYATVNVAGDGGTGSDHLAVIDTATGVATIVGPFGACTGVTIPSDGGGSCTLDGIEGIAFDRTGVLWGAHRARGAAGSPGLYTINPSTGEASFVVSLLDETGIPSSGGVVSLQFGCSGTLYGGTSRAVAPAIDGGKLIIIEPAMGRFIFVGPDSATGGPSLGALARQERCR